MTEAPFEFLEGGGENPASFWELDMNNQLKLKSFVPLGMPFVFRNLHKNFNLFEMRKRGLVPIVYHMDFRSELVPLAFGSRVESSHRIRLYRYTPTAEETARGTGRERLMEHIHIDFSGRRSMGSREQLGYDERSGPKEFLGSGRILHVFTRPLAPPGERNVTEVPPEMRIMREHPWTEPFPTIGLMHEIPEGFAMQDTDSWGEHRSVWGLPNTDINQHVNVVEYLMAAENHFIRMLYGAEVPAAKHQMTRLCLLFRKPFFPGDAFTIRGTLWRSDRRTLMTAGIHLMQRGGSPDERAAVGIRCEGVASPE